MARETAVHADGVAWPKGVDSEPGLAEAGYRRRGMAEGRGTPNPASPRPATEGVACHAKDVVNRPTLLLS